MSVCSVGSAGYAAHPAPTPSPASAAPATAPAASLPALSSTALLDVYA